MLDLLITVALAHGLGSEAHATRQACHDAIESRGDTPYAVLTTTLERGDSEQRWRAADLLSKIEGRMWRRIGLLPCIDAAWYVPGKGYEEEQPGGVWIVYLRYRGGYPYRGYTDGARALFHDLRRQGCCELTLYLLAETMRRQDLHFLQRVHPGRDHIREVFVRP